MKKNLYRNKSGCYDPTAGEALRNVEYDWDRVYLAQQAKYEFLRELRKIGVRANYIRMWDKFSGDRVDE